MSINKCNKKSQQFLESPALISALQETTFLDDPQDRHSEGLRQWWVQSLITDVGSETQRSEDRKKHTSDSECGRYLLGMMTCSERSHGLCRGQSKGPRVQPQFSPLQSSEHPWVLQLGLPFLLDLHLSSVPPRSSAVLLGPTSCSHLPKSSTLLILLWSSGSSPAWPAQLSLFSG